MDRENELLTINDLPSEVLASIFTHLSPKMIKCCALVCNRWNDIIGDSRDLMNKFVLNLEEESDLKIEKATHVLNRRKLRSLKLSSMSIAVQSLISAHNIRHLHLTGGAISAGDLNACFENLSFLESFYGKIGRISDKSQLKRHKFAKLKTLHVEYSEIELIYSFDTCSLEEAYLAPMNDGNRSSLIFRFISNQKNLKRLAIGSQLSETFLDAKRDCADFGCGQLESFRIERGPLGTITHEHLTKFLSNHGERLKKLELFYPAERHIYEFVLGGLPNLVHLDILVTSLSEMSESEIKQFPVHGGIKFVTFLGEFKSLRSAHAIIDLFPSLTGIDLSNLTTKVFFMQVLLQIAQSRLDLEVLKIPNLFHQFNNEIHFPKLKEFFVKKISNEVHYNLFLKRHKDTLEKITIASIDDDIFVRGLTVNAIMSCENLSRLTIHCTSPLVTRMLKIIVKEDDTRRWTLESNIREDMKVVRIVFNFPEDIAVFKGKCEHFSSALVRELNTFQNVGLNVFVNSFK